MTELFVANTDCLKNKELFDALYHTLPAFRREKVDRLQSTEKTALSMGAFILLTEALKKKGIPREEIAFTYNPYGKPTLINFPQVHFNLAHSGNMTFCAVSDSEVGCDAEQIRKVDLKLANRFFTPQEQAQINAQPTPESKEKMFFRLWTLKESFIKMTGQTLAALSGFSISLNADSITVDQTYNPDKAFYFQEFSLQDGYCCACCAEQNDFSEIKIVNFESL